MEPSCDHEFIDEESQTEGLSFAILWYNILFYFPVNKAGFCRHTAKGRTRIIAKVLKGEVS